MIEAWSEIRTPVIGMLHLLPLLGAPRHSGDLAEIERKLLCDAEALAEGGVHGLMMENFGDVPFYPWSVPAHVVSQMTRLALVVRQRYDLPMGINVLRNDSRSALAIAAAVGANFIRVNVLCGVRMAGEGMITGMAHDLQRDRLILGAREIKILADIDVKHAAGMAPTAIEDEVTDTINRGLADAVIVSGTRTGQATDLQTLERVKAAARSPVLVGSGVTADTIARYLQHADGFIIGTAFKVDGVTTNPVDPQRVRALLQAL